MQNDGLTLQTVVLHWNIERRRNNCTVLIRDVSIVFLYHRAMPYGICHLFLLPCQGREKGNLNQQYNGRLAVIIS